MNLEIETSQEMNTFQKVLQIQRQCFITIEDIRFLMSVKWFTPSFSPAMLKLWFRFTEHLHDDIDVDSVRVNSEFIDFQALQKEV